LICLQKFRFAFGDLWRTFIPACVRAANVKTPGNVFFFNSPGSRRVPILTEAEMQKFSRLFAAAGVGVLALVMGASSASAAPITISSTVDQSGFLGNQNAATYPLTGTPYDYTGQGYASLTSITGITVTLTVNDGNTGPGEFDENNLTLGLDGIDTGLKLNGFTANNIVSLDLSGNPALAAQLLSALQADGQLVGTIIDATPGNAPAGDFIGLPGLVQTTLDVTGDVRGNNGGGGNPVPLPAAILLAPVGAGIAGGFARRFRKAK
jgi:hypothetical protein